MCISLLSIEIKYFQKDTWPRSGSTFPDGAKSGDHEGLDLLTNTLEFPKGRVECDELTSVYGLFIASY